MSHRVVSDFWAIRFSSVVIGGPLAGETAPKVAVPLNETNARPSIEPPPEWKFLFSGCLDDQTQNPPGAERRNGSRRGPRSLRRRGTRKTAQEIGENRFVAGVSTRCDLEPAPRLELGTC